MKVFILQTTITMSISPHRSIIIKYRKLPDSSESLGAPLGWKVRDCLESRQKKVIIDYVLR